MDMITYLKEIVDLAPLVGTDHISGVRFNPLKLSAKEFEAAFPAAITPAAYFAGGYQLTEESAGLGNHPLHLSGGCYFQEPSAMSAVTALQVRDGERVLDVCAAPGSKATALASANPNGITVANEIHPRRAKILVSNMERMGISAALITGSDAPTLAAAFGSYFDKILVDAPCSGEGMFRKYPEILNDWTEELVTMCAARSREILEHAATMLRPGGRLVYSTCTFNLEENEKNILDFLDKHPEFSVAEHGISGAREGLLGLTGAARIFPDEKGEGHFVCALQKDASAPENAVKIDNFTSDKKPLAHIEKLLSECVKMPLAFYGNQRQYIFKEIGQNVQVIPADLPYPRGVKILRAGVQATMTKGKTAVPCQHLFTATPVDRFLRTVTLSREQADAFLRGEGIESGGKGFTAVLYEGICLGFGKAVDGVLKNHYPKGLRL